MSLLGIAIFFILAAIVALSVWLTTGDWREFAGEIAFVSLFVAIPIANYIWNNYMARHYREP